MGVLSTPLRDDFKLRAAHGRGCTGDWFALAPRPAGPWAQVGLRDIGGFLRELRLVVTG
jgi:hypothetical protein